MSSSCERPSFPIRSAVLFGGLVLELACLTTSVSCAKSNDADGDSHIDGSDGLSSEDAGSPSTDATSNSRDGASVENAEWSPATTSHDPRLGLAAIWGTGKNDVWAVGASGSVLHWDGASWTSASLGTNASLNVVGGAGANDVWVASSLSQIFHIDGFDGGTLHWSAATPIESFSETTFLYAVWASSPSDVWLGGTGASERNLWKTSTTGGDFAWRQMADNPTTLDNGFTAPTIYGIWGSRRDDVWCVGRQNAPSPPSFAAHLDGLPDGGDMPTWTEVDTQSTSPLNAVWGADASDIWAVGDHGTIRRFRGTPRPGALWEIVASPTTEHLRGLWGSSSSDIWAVGEQGTFLHYDGTTWRSVPAVFPSDLVPNLRGVWGADAENIWAVGDGIVMRHARPDAAGQGGLP